ncbi:MAG: outer membrane protein assembly factor BamD [Thermoanaerobaculia bacterium]|nr:outer membrane protein assembly factor BamD [Thermoanaerobaculia bacterium]MBP9823031.1 outer membrane protein assembly factor BamD [Thermoanaerobaculia bacterium]
MNSNLIRRLTALAIVPVLSVLAVSCKSNIQNDPILRLSAAESLAEGKRLFELEKFEKARPYFSHAFEVEPNSSSGREALLMVADCYSLTGSTADLIQAEAKYRDFQNRFPTSDRAAYVQFQIASSLARRIERADRDQAATVKAREALEELIRLYPTSEYAEKARAELVIVIDRLAEHEFVVGRFYQRYGVPGATVARIEGLLKNFPGYSGTDAALYYLGLAYIDLARPEDAATTFARLREEHPESRYVRKASKQG